MWCNLLYQNNNIIFLGVIEDETKKGKSHDKKNFILRSIEKKEETQCNNNGRISGTGLRERQ